MSDWLVSLDTDRIKQYVFSTGRLKEIMGASALLDDLNRRQTEALVDEFGGTLIYTGGGSCVATFSDENKAKKFCAAVEALYRRETVIASITGVVEQNSGNFPDVLKRAAAGLQHRKAECESIGEVFLAQPHWARCSRCGARPAQTVSLGQPVCFACAVRRTARGKHSPENRLKDAFGADWQDGKKYPETLEDLSDVLPPNNYVGLIYADGNGIGGLIEDGKVSQSREELSAFSKILEEALISSTVTALKPFVSAVRGEYVPFLPILLGGDDLILLTSASLALTVANKICNGFQEYLFSESQKLQQKSDQSGWFGGQPIRVSMSAGVVIAKAAHPIYMLESLAEELLHNAKELSAEIKNEFDKVCGTLNFRVITAPTARSWSQVLKTEFELSQAPGESKLATARPYPCQDFDGLKRPTWQNLEESILDLREKSFARNKIHAWQEPLAASSDIEAELLWSILSSRWNQDQRAAADEITAKKLKMEGWRSYYIELDHNHKIAPLPDLEEIFEYVHPFDGV